MNSRLIIAVTLTIIIGFLLIIGGLVAVYKFYPTYLGLPPNPADTLQKVESEEADIIDTVYIEPRIEVPVTEYDLFQSSKIKNAVLNYQKKEIINQKQKLIDSISNILKNYAVIRDSIKNYKDALNKGTNYSLALNDSISKLSEKLNNLVKENDNAKKIIEEQDKRNIKKTDSLTVKNLEEFAKIYNNSNPAEVAKILEQLDERDAALILKKMSKKKAAKVLESMLPENAAAIMILGIGDK